jgi:fibro-slime domain-containing protein
LSRIAIGTNATLIVRLVNNDTDTKTSVELNPALSFIASPFGTVNNTTPQENSGNRQQINFVHLQDITSNIKFEYGTTTFNDQKGILRAGLTLINYSYKEFRGPILVGIRNISDPSVVVTGYDGMTPDGMFYFDVSHFAFSGRDYTFSPDEIIRGLDLQFLNPDHVQFTYDIVILAHINTAPTFVSTPKMSITAGNEYVYNAGATDSENDTLRYEKVFGPETMFIDMATGQITWQTTENDTGVHAVTIRVYDTEGLRDEQKIFIDVTQTINHPPYFTSTPETEAFVGSIYHYQATADDPDGDHLTYSLVDAFVTKTGEPLATFTPTHWLTVTEDGKVTWNPPVDLVGETITVTLEVSDGKSGTALQTYLIGIHKATGNNDPIIISEPITKIAVNETSVGKTITLNATIRDFTSIHSDFATSGGGAGMVQEILGDDKLPRLTEYHYSIQSEDTFGQWHHDVEGVNMTTVLPLTLTETYEGSGIYEYINSSFFPIDNLLLGNEGSYHNYYFTLELHASFVYRGGEVFNFTGDDDVWVYIDNRLVVDLGGIHGAISGSVSLDTLGLTIGETYDFDLFFAERCMTESNFRLQTSIVLAPDVEYLYDTEAIDADNDVLTYSLLSGPEGMTIDSNTGEIFWTPQKRDIGDHEVIVQVMDGWGGYDTQTYIISVVLPGYGIIGGTVFNDSNTNGHLDSNEGICDQMTVYIDQNDNGRYDIGEITTSTDRNGYYSFNNLPAGIYTVRLILPTGWLQSIPTEESYTITITNSEAFRQCNFGNYLASEWNTSPKIISTAPNNVVCNTDYWYEIKVVDPDNDDIVYSLLFAPEGMVIHPELGIITWHPTKTQIGKHQVAVCVSDGRGDFVTQIFEITVLSDNIVPHIISLPNGQIALNTPWSYQVIAIDPNGDSLTYSLNEASIRNGFMIDTETGLVILILL